MSHMCRVHRDVLLHFYKHLFLNSYGLKLELMFIQLFRICPFRSGMFSQGVVVVLLETNEPSQLTSLSLPPLMFMSNIGKSY